MSRFETKSAARTLVPDSPAAKRQKTGGGGGYQSTSTGYNSEVDSGDELFEGIVDTPVSKHFTQPTQILARTGTQLTQILPRCEGQQIIGRTADSSSPVRGSSPIVQIPASSPFQLPPTLIFNHQRPDPNVGRLASLMAPAGTTFRPPNQRPVAKPIPKKPAVIDISDDDGPQYKGGSSDSDEISRAEIKPSNLTAISSKSGFGSIPTSPESAFARFKSITASSMFTPGPTRPVSGLKEGFHDLRNIGLAINSSRMVNQIGHRKPEAQSRPSRAMPVLEMKEEDISDFEMRRKVTRLLALSPKLTVQMCLNALQTCRGHFDDAANLLLDRQDISDDEDDLPTLTNLIHEPQMKQRLNAPIKSIAKRYTTSTQLPRKTSPSSASSSRKPRRRLQQGRRYPSSPVQPLVGTPIAAKKGVKPAVEEDFESDRDSLDSGLGSEPEGDPELEDRDLRYLNTCKAEDLAEFVNVGFEDAKLMVTNQPYKTLDAAREVSNSKTTKSGKKSSKAIVGDRIVDSAIRMQAGYEAVDILVEECQRLGRPLAEAIGKWGYNVYGASTGEGSGLEINSVDCDDDSMKDSGLCSPNSKATSNSGEADDDDLQFVASRQKRQTKFIDKPSIMADDFVLKDFQRVGLNWLALLYKHELSCILADEMGCGKTCQVISFLAHLTESGIDPGPHLVIVPPSTLENWLREFGRFCPKLVVDPYYGSQKEREEIAHNILQKRDDINVVISTYSMTEKPLDCKFLRRLNPNVCVYDEGHMLKNPRTIRYKSLMKIPAKFRVLLTGTPLQNNLMELAALLSFILPTIFSEQHENLEHVFKHKATTSATSHAALLNKERIARAKSMLTPFILQRKADVVLKDLPAKTNRVEYCELHPIQAVVYEGLRDKTRHRAEQRLKGVSIPRDDENNPVMQARKAALHPMLFRRHFTDAKLVQMLKLLQKHHADEFTGRSEHIMKEMQGLSDAYLHIWCQKYSAIAKFDVPPQSCMNSGKVEALVRLLEQYKANGDRVLVFSQFVLMLDVLEEVLQTAFIPFSRIDGSTGVNDRQTIIDNFRNDESITAFLLSTGAGGTGINLEMANKVIIFDGSFNPHDDVQAEKRAHRLGQTRPVEVVRMVTQNTIEEQIHALGQMKLTLDLKVTATDDDSSAEKMVLKMLLQGEKGAVSGKEVPNAVNAGSEKVGESVKAGELEIESDGIELSANSKKNTFLVTRKKQEPQSDSDD